MKISYIKNREFILFGKKVWELKTSYIEHSRDEDSDEDILYINIATDKLKQKGKNNEDNNKG